MFTLSCRHNSKKSLGVFWCKHEGVHFDDDVDDLIQPHSQLALVSMDNRVNNGVNEYGEMSKKRVEQVEQVGHSVVSTVVSTELVLWLVQLLVLV